MSGLLLSSWSEGDGHEEGRSKHSFIEELGMGDSPLLWVSLWMSEWRSEEEHSFSYPW